MISEMNIAVSKGSLFAKDGKNQLPRSFLASLQVDRPAWSCARETSSSLAGQFASDVWMVDGDVVWLFQVSTEGTLRMTRWFLKKFPTSSISIWGRLPCWLMFFLDWNQQASCITFNGLERFLSLRKEALRIAYSVRLCFGALGNQSHTTTNTFKSFQNGTQNGTCQTKPAGTLLWLQEFLIGVPWFFFGFKQLFHATNLFWHLSPLSNKVWGSPCVLYGF